MGALKKENNVGNIKSHRSRPSYREKFAPNPSSSKDLTDKGKQRKQLLISSQSVNHIKREHRRYPLQRSNELFERLGMPNNPKTRCNIRKKIGECGKANIRKNEFNGLKNT